MKDDIIAKLIGNNYLDLCTTHLIRWNHSLYWLNELQIVMEEDGPDKWQ
jgi:hypothetical protein